MKTDHVQGDPLVKFLPFDKQHLAPLRDVTPEAIKEAAHAAVAWPYRHREPIQLTTAMNFIVCRLGLSGGMAEFQHRHAAALREFMNAHGLNKRADLIRTEPRMKFVALQPRQVGDALFLSGRPLPERIFTAYDVDWFELNNRYFHHNGWNGHPGRDSSDTLPFDVVVREIAAAAKANPAAGADVLDAAVAACQMSVVAGANNMLGDQLCVYPGKDRDTFAFVPQLYQQPGLAPADFHRHQEKIREVVRFFRLWMRQSEKGWVRVLPYNEALIFLQGVDGAYDFLVPGFRDTAFSGDSFPRATDGAGEPRAEEDFHFQRWLYFLYDGWLEQEEHRAELTYYAAGGVPREHPGSAEILRRHLIGSGAYKPRPEAAS
ncbi:MAG: hypothetical protein NTV51_12535 [Verrucomicrobia bacterium]|nr:hypothetical protein [Verrucomicrobiota bacterium]